MNSVTPDAVFPRSFTDGYPLAERGEGVYLFDTDGKRYLDACGGAAVVSIGHGVQEIVEAVSRQTQRLAYCHSSQFHTEVEAELAQFLSDRFPGPRQQIRVHFTSGGSESTETAIKIIWQYWLARGQTQRQKFVSRWHSYHGTTLGALALSGNKKRRHDYQALLVDVAHIAPCFCYHCWLGKQFPACELACARELDAAIGELGKEKIAGFFLEPVVGATSGAVPVPGYLKEVRDICSAHDVLLVADEVMTGVGRTGKYFAVEHWGIVPDLILLGKGLTSGYAPLGAVLVSEKVWRTIRDASRTLQHGFTYQAHPPSVAAGLAVQKYLQKHNLVERCGKAGEYLASKLETLRGKNHVGDVRGKGLLQVIEFVQDHNGSKPFASERKISKRIFADLRSQGALVYPGVGTVDGSSGDHILVAPPFIIENTEMDWLVERIGDAVTNVCGSVRESSLPGFKLKFLGCFQGVSRQNMTAMGPTYEEMLNPTKQPEWARRAAAGARKSELDPANLFNLNWRTSNNEIRHLLLTPQFTGIEANIVVLIGRDFPSGSHKVGPAYSMLMESELAGEVNPKTSMIIAPSTGNFGIGVAYISRLKHYPSIVIMPDQMSRERYERIRQYGAKLDLTPGSESDVILVLKRAREYARDARNKVMAQFELLPNYRFHRYVTGGSVIEAVSRYGNGRVAAFVCAPGSAGTLAAGDEIKMRFPDSVVVALEPRECPTLFSGGCGTHRIEGIGDKMVPLIHNVLSTDFVALIHDDDCVKGLALLQQHQQSLERTLYLEGGSLQRLSGVLGISGVCNVLGSIRMARFLQLGPKENVVTVATDGFDRYPSVLADLEKRVGPITDTTLARWSEEVFRNSQDTRDILDTRPLRQKERLFRCKEELWTQFGYSLAYLDRMKSAGFWEEEREKINVVDAQLLQSRN